MSVERQDRVSPLVEVSSTDLTLDMIPGSGMPDEMNWDIFALSYRGYDRHGDECPKMAIRVSKKFRETGELPDDIDLIRNALFFLQRCFYHTGGTPPSRQQILYNKALLAKLRSLIGQ